VGIKIYINQSELISMMMMLMMLNFCREPRIEKGYDYK
jgi:hypothetical protein